MGDVRELNKFEHGQLMSALLQIGDRVGMGTAEGITAFLAGRLTVCKVRQLELVGVISIDTSSGTKSFACHRLLVRSTSVEIISELGGEANAETTDEEIKILTERQKDGGVGALNAKAWNIFFVRRNGVLRSVRVYWRGVGWRVFANSDADTFGWAVGSQVFSRNSVPVSSDTSAPASA